MGNYAFGADLSHSITTLDEIEVATTTASRLTALPIATKLVAKQGVIVQADPDNSGTIYVGGEGVTVDSGIALEAGASVTLPVGDPYKIFAIASGADQVARVSYV